MTHTSWRDDYTRIVKGRAIAYADERDGFRTEMPFENVHGNGGLLTTVGDLLKWNENFVAPTVGDAAFVAEQQQPRPLQRRPHAQLRARSDGRARTRACARSTTADRRRLSRAPRALSGRRACRWRCCATRAPPPPRPTRTGRGSAIWPIG